MKLHLPLKIVLLDIILHLEVTANRNVMKEPWVTCALMKLSLPPKIISIEMILACSYQ